MKGNLSSFQVLLAVGAFLLSHLHFFNSTTQRYKDCSVPWVSHASAAAATASGGGGQGSGKRLRIALVSMSTGRARDPAAAQRQSDLNARSAEFAGLLDITGPNKRAYAALHGYTFVDASELLDASRPASWSKIPAVLSVLDSYDWVFWNDADTVITNTSLPLEALLPYTVTHLPYGSSSSSTPQEPQEPGGTGDAKALGADAAASAWGGGGGGGPDLVLTADSTGVNAGVWLIRGAGCAWCRAFLERWWGMEAFVRRGRGDTRSGDNDALKDLIARMASSELAAHVGLAPQCAFNSYVWRPSLRNWARYLAHPRRILTGLWQPGDFLMHPAGVRNKRRALVRALEAAAAGMEADAEAEAGGEGKAAGDGAALLPSASTPPSWGDAGAEGEKGGLLGSAREAPPTAAGGPGGRGRGGAAVGRG
ncbi:hypothetical protein GPECTOR_42g849 [Gonium pectorale]|uniref:Uncharacterized protein n=1 Tax=Gonium pectorale TaxID=33097 RepID=A0A150G9Y1_GONPE|nr:hypothetical protein GPECTOR_42g849 [Gonium pectorale]|eukprot:KXZ46638.1 hypothetical protein GPECTOR_42g849 [Gonium pectorale]